jgi:hypothetical protein
MTSQCDSRRGRIALRGRWLSMTTLLDLSKISEGIVGLADIIGRLAKNIEQAILSGIRSGDAIRRARERRRLRNFMLFTAHLYREQLRFVSSLSLFCADPREERMEWEAAKLEIVTVTELMSKIEKYILPYSDALVVRHRKQYLEVLAALDARRRLLDQVAKLEYGDALVNLKSLRKIGQAYERLMDELKSISLELGSIGAEDEEMWRLATSAKDFEPLDVETPKKRQSTPTKRKRSTVASK